MARNRIEELLVQLKFQGAEELKKISGGFRELAKAVNLADADIEDARTKIIDYGKTLGNTNQAVKGTIQALKALQDSTNRGGEAWVQLSRDVLGFEQAARLTDREIESLRRGIVAEASAHSQSETSIRAHVSALQQLRAQSVLGGQVNRQLAQSIGQLTQQLDQAEQASRAHFSALNQALAVRPDAVLRQFQAYTEVLRDVRATAEQAAEAQQRLNQLAGAPRIAARRELVARTGIQSDPAYQERFGLAGRSLEELPDVPAALSLRLRELQEDLNFTTRNTQLYVSTLVEMASVQRQASATTQGFAAALREQLASGQLAPTQKNLQEVIGALRREMLELDTTTTEGGRAYAENARQADVLERQLKELASSYRNVADMATQAATAERSSAAARVTALYMSNRAVQEQAQAMRDLGTAVRSGVAGTPLMLPAAGMTSAPGTGQARSGGARNRLVDAAANEFVDGVEATFSDALTRRLKTAGERSGYFNPPTADVGVPPALGMSSEGFEAQIKMQAKAAKDAAADLSAYRVEIQQAAAANNGSINSIQRYRDSLVALRNTLPATGAEFKQLSRQVQQLDAQLERSQRRRRRMSATQATQAAGAVISGGIFGGPEGAIGGAVGTAIGGVPGAFAGAAIGAQVGMIRQSLGQMAAFTAEIDKQRIALRNVVGTQAEYERSLQFIDATSRRLAIPQDQLNKQFTQLSASVIGAGGNVDAAKLAFEGIAAGIRGTGGNLSDMQSALLATSQVFSKGKVSAEELRQQIGERLPGAFTIFAQSIGKTPQELDKMLESGEVGLNDFMKFVQELTRRYGSSANEIAASSQSAGDRMATTFARIREAVGRELQPVGAQFQEAFATAFAENEQAIVDFAKSIATAAKVVADNAGLIAESLKVLLGFGAIAAAIPLATSVAATFAKVSLAIASMGGAASVAGLAVKGLIASLLAVSPFGWIAAGVVGLGLLGKAVYDNNEIFKNWVDNIGGVVAGDFRNSMDAMAGDAESATNRISGAFEGLGQNMSSVGNFIQQVFDDLFGFVSQSGASSASQVDNSWADAMSNIGANTSAAFDGLTEMLANWWEALPAPLRNILGGNTASALAGAAQYAAGASSRAAQGGPVGTFGDTGGFGRYGAPSSQVRFRSRRTGSFSFDRGAGAGGGASGGAGKAAKGPESRAAELRIELNLMDQLLEAESLISQARLENNEREAAILQTLVAQTRLASEAAKLELEKIPAKDKALRLQILTRQSTQKSAELAFTLAEQEKKANDELKKSMEAVSKQVAEFKDRAAFEREYGELITQGTLPATAKQYLETRKVVEETIRAAEAALVKAEADGASADEIERQRKELERIKGEGRAEQDRVAGGDAPGRVIGDAIIRIQGELNELMNIGNQVVGAATAIGDAFGNSFKGVITGSMTAKEALASFFSSVAEYFADMAAKMIAEWIKLAILNTVLKLFPGFGGAGAGLSDLSAPATINNPLGVLNANGNAFASNNIIPYANGGIVNRPTMFKFARGGAMATGVMGEAGPEAIMPLKRGADGKLGVASAGGSNVTVNVSVDAKGTQVQGDPGQGAQLGRVIAGAVQQELIKQQRPGGLLAGAK
jgi:lambda family phage tail tape measure protein